MLRESLAFNLQMPELQFYKMLELFISYKTEYILTFFSYLRLFFVSLLMAVPSSVNVKPN